MKDNMHNDRNDDQLDNNDDQLRPNTMNEMIREVNGDADTDLNALREDEGMQHSHRGSGGGNNSDLTQGMSYSPNDASGVRSGGTADMDNQTASGAGQAGAARRGMGSNLAPKTGITGSDFDGQVSSS